MLSLWACAQTVTSQSSLQEIGTVLKEDRRVLSPNVSPQLVLILLHMCGSRDATCKTVTSGQQLLQQRTVQC